MPNRGVNTSFVQGSPNNRFVDCETARFGLLGTYGLYDAI